VLSAILIISDINIYISIDLNIDINIYISIDLSIGVSVRSCIS
jgi:hypothetical protein